MNVTPEKSNDVQTQAERYRKGRRTFTWLAVFFCTVFAAAVVWQIYLINARAKAMRGDGVHAETYGFDLSNLTVPGETLVGAKMKKDGVVALTDPMRVTVDNALELKRYGARYATIELIDHIADSPGGAFKKILVDSDRVIGVEHKGEVRCYPLQFMRWHEVANDTLGGDPIAVTYSPLTDGVVAFRRTVGDEVLTFGHSGLVFNSYHVLYDVRPGKDDPDQQDEKAESLWVPLKLSPIAGPAVTRGDTLEPIKAWLGSWKDWRAMHPDTTVLVGNARFGKRYKDDPFARMQYFENQELMFPVKPELPEELTTTDHIRPFQRVVGWKTSDGWQMTAMPEEGQPEGLPPDAPRMYTRWFAWYSIRGGD